MLRKGSTYRKHVTNFARFSLPFPFSKVATRKCEIAYAAGVLFLLGTAASRNNLRVIFKQGENRKKSMDEGRQLRISIGIMKGLSGGTSSEHLWLMAAVDCCLPSP